MILQGQKGKYYRRLQGHAELVHAGDSIPPPQVLDPAQAKTTPQALTHTLEVRLQLAVTHCC